MSHPFQGLAGAFTNRKARVGLQHCRLFDVMVIPLYLFHLESIIVFFCFVTDNPRRISIIKIV